MGISFYSFILFYWRVCVCVVSSRLMNIKVLFISVVQNTLSHIFAYLIFTHAIQKIYLSFIFGCAATNSCA